MRFYFQFILLAACGLLATQQAAAQCPPSSSPAHHRVQKGETLYRIAKQHGVTVNQLATWNNMQATDVLHICQELAVARTGATPAPTAPTGPNQPNQHVIRSGETMASIAAQYGYTEERFRRMNKLNTSEPAWPGMALKTSDCTCPPPGTPAPNERQGATVQIGKIDAPPITTNPSQPTSPSAPASTTSPSFSTDGGLGLNSGAGALGDPFSLSQPTRQTSSIHEDPYGLKLGTTTPYANEIAPLTIAQANSASPSAKNKQTKETPSQPKPGIFAPAEQQLIYRENQPAPTGANRSIPLATTASAPYMTVEEIAMVNEINLVRGNPVGYITYIENYREKVRRGQAFGSVTTCDELIEELRRTPPLTVLNPSECLFQVAKKHGLDQRPTGSVDHVGTDGSYPWDRVRRTCPDLVDGNENIVAGPAAVRDAVILLLVDEAIANRGHRRTILQNDWKYVACYKIGQVGSVPNTWLQLFGK